MNDNGRIDSEYWGIERLSYEDELDAFRNAHATQLNESDTLAVTPMSENACSSGMTGEHDHLSWPFECMTPAERANIS